MKNVSPGINDVPFTAFLALTTTSAEMLLASIQVIGHRTERLLKLEPANAEDQRELALMTSEKIEAAADSSKSMAFHWMTMWNELAGRVLSAQHEVTAALASLALSPTPGAAMAGHKNLSNVVAGFSSSAEKFAGDAWNLVERGVAPFHSAALANAKRLGNV
jgi:hypothetical protein